MKKHKLDSFRIRIRRSNDGMILGVLRGFAENYGWSVLWTRIVGAVALLILPSLFPGQNNGGFFAAGFFYLLLALLMEPPLKEGESPWQSENASTSTAESWLARHAGGREHFSRWRRGSGASSAVAPPPIPVSAGGRPDLSALNRQLDSLNRRIARMESIVTRREYDWSRRLED